MGRVRTLSVSLCIDSREELQPSLTLVGTERGFSRRDCPQLRQLANEAPPSHPKKAYKRTSEVRPGIYDAKGPNKRDALRPKDGTSRSVAEQGCVKPNRDEDR